jgi:hypothetical protein
MLVKNRETTGRNSVNRLERRQEGTVLVKNRETTGRNSVSED